MLLVGDRKGIWLVITTSSVDAEIPRHQSHWTELPVPWFSHPLGLVLDNVLQCGLHFFGLVFHNISINLGYFDTRFYANI